MQIDPKHLLLPKHSLSGPVLEAVNRLVQTGTSCQNIIIYIYSTFNVSLAYKTVYNIRNNYINDIIDQCSDDPAGSSVNRLINLFKNSNNVSFMYVMHDYNSGFVTHAMSKKQKQRLLDRNNDSNMASFSNNKEYSSSIKNWRDELKLSPTNDILVAFAWAHDDEVRNAQMFPEFLGVDVTFGVNKEKREMLLVAGMDGHKRTFTAFRCFMPSKQQAAYSWVMNVALRSLLTNDVLIHNQCISSDQEPALNTAIEASIQSHHNAFSYSNFHLDMYHFF